MSDSSAYCPNDPLAQNPEMKQYFSTLPKFVQESIKQSGVPLNSKAEMQQFADNLLKNNN